MDLYFITQIVTSFFVGGLFITFLSFLAEYIDNKYSGIVLTFPSTLAIGLFFLGWTLGPQKVANVTPAILLSLGFAILYSAIYFYCSLLLKNLGKIIQITMSFTLSSFFWFMLILPFIVGKFSNLLLGITGYAVLILLIHIGTKDWPCNIYRKCHCCCCYFW
jgi:hypothetical protein